jgi:hypothetical protein
MVSQNQISGGGAEMVSKRVRDESIYQTTYLSLVHTVYTE